MNTHVVQPGDQVIVQVDACAVDLQPVTFAVEVIQPEPPASDMPWEDVTATFPTNPTAQNPYQSSGRWATRTPTGITVHHTGTNDAYALARVCLGKAYMINGVVRYGLPTTQYHIFVQQDGSALLCVPLEQGFWHDHAGYPNANISVGVAGYWHKTRPPVTLIEGLARVCARLMGMYDIPVARVVGHRDRALPNGIGTECPGWYPAPLGSGWRDDFYAALGVLI
ncbi:MAG: N-acetylmuramoyl-L-alanine amidase [Anaerolineae bacterium]|nr:N-acetylmuramoyl-L-alanine amidase [Anaerolineae bacterium]